MRDLDGGAAVARAGVGCLILWWLSGLLRWPRSWMAKQVELELLSPRLLPLTPEREQAAVRLLTELLLGEVVKRQADARVPSPIAVLLCCSLPGAGRRAKRHERTGLTRAAVRRSRLVRGWSFLVVVSCGRSTNDQLGVSEGRMVSGFWGCADTATLYPQFMSFDSAVWPSSAAALAAATSNISNWPSACAGRPAARPRASDGAARGTAPRRRSLLLVAGRRPTPTEPR